MRMVVAVPVRTGGVAGVSVCGAYSKELGQFYSWSSSPEVIALSARVKTESSPYMELFNVVMMVNTWKHLLPGHRVMLINDCKPMMDAVTKGFSDRDPIRHLINRLDQLGGEFGFSVRVQWLPRLSTPARLADMLSRGGASIPLFLQEFPEVAFSQVIPLPPKPLVL
jgi:hypothetical protein